MYVEDLWGGQCQRNTSYSHKRSSKQPVQLSSLETPASQGLCTSINSLSINIEDEIIILIISSSIIIKKLPEKSLNVILNVITPFCSGLKVSRLV